MTRIMHRKRYKVGDVVVLNSDGCYPAYLNGTIVTIARTEGPNYYTQEYEVHIRPNEIERRATEIERLRLALTGKVTL